MLNERDPRRCFEVFVLRRFADGLEQCLGENGPAVRSRGEFGRVLDVLGQGDGYRRWADRFLKGEGGFDTGVVGIQDEVRACERAEVVDLVRSYAGSEQPQYRIAPLAQREDVEYALDNANSGRATHLIPAQQWLCARQAQVLGHVVGEIFLQCAADQPHRLPSTQLRDNDAICHELMACSGEQAQMERRSKGQLQGSPSTEYTP